MKLNNLSRLTALLMAVMMLGMSSAVAESSGVDISDLTEGDLIELDETTALIEALTEAGYCETCAKDVASAGLTEWPVAGYTCLYKQLAELTPSEAYDMLIAYYNAGTAEGDAMYKAYINSHNNHVINAQIAGSSDYPAVICDGCSYLVLQPGAEGHAESCPWYDEVYTPSVTATPDVSTPDALKNAYDQAVTTITLSVGVTGDGMSYIWQTSANPGDENAVWTDITGATASTYDLPITPAALVQAYRCVATAADGTQTISAPFYLGGEAFFTWATTAEGVSEWLTDSATYAHVTVEYAVVAYEKYIGGIALSEVIHLITVTVDTTSTTYLIELYGGTTLATMDANNQLIDERYHIAVAQVDENGNILPLETTTATTTE